MERENDLLEAFEAIIKEIKESEDYKNLLLITKELSKNKEIISLVEEIKELQKEIVSKEAQKKNVKDELSKLDDLTKNLFNIPIYTEYYYLNKNIQLEIDLLTKTIEKEINKVCEVEND